MTVLPILERELRLRARSPASYWTRLGLAAVGLLVALPPLTWAAPSFSTPASIGRGVFNAIISAGFVVSCVACLLTSESISAERREGTLGLLLLTRVRHFDVLLGKFASSGMTAFFALVTFMPVLMIPVLAGGVTGGEAFRKGLVLLNTLFLALAAGLWASARGEEWFRTARRAVVLMLVLVLVPELVGLIAYGSKLEWVSPLGTLLAAGDLEYKKAPWAYQMSLLLVHAVGWGLLLHALRRMRDQAGSEEFRQERAGAGTGARGGGGAGVAQPAAMELETPSDSEAVPPVLAESGKRTPQPWRESAAAPTPLHWLLRRQRGLKPMLWLAVGVSFLQYFLYLFIGRFIGISGYPALLWSYGFVAAVVTGSIFAWVASRFFIEARRTGEIELLLTTPVGAQGIISAQWQVLKRLLRWPVVVILLPSLLQVVLYLGVMRVFRSQSEWWRIYYGLSTLAGAFATVFGIGALCWVGMWFGLRSAGQARAILWTVVLVRGAPFALNLVWSILSRPLVARLAGPGSAAYMLVGSLLPQVAYVVVYLWLIHLARNQLRKELSGAEPVALRQIVSDVSAKGRSAIRLVRNWPPVR